MKTLEEMFFFVHLLLLLCPVYEGANLRRLRYVQYPGQNPGSRTWKEARKFCRNRQIDLVSITNKSDNVFIKSLSGWIGLYRDGPNSAWKWSRGDETANFTVWSENPNNNEHCAHKFTNDIGWRTDECNTLHSFICYRKSLILVKENKTWEDALVHCRSLKVKNPNAYNSHRYDLATLLTPDDHDYAKEMIQEATTDMVWTGLRFLAGRWMWVGGEQLQHMIERCEDDQACGGLSKSNSDPYKRGMCERKFNFLCSLRR